MCALPVSVAARRVETMSAQSLTLMESSLRDMLGRAATIGSLSAADRAQLDGLLEKADTAKAAYAPVADTPIGAREYVRAMVALLTDAHQVLEKYSG